MDISLRASLDAYGVERGTDDGSAPTSFRCLLTRSARLDVTGRQAPEQPHTKSLAGTQEGEGVIEDEGSAWNVGVGLASQQRNPGKHVCWAWVKKNPLFSTDDDSEVDEGREGRFPG